MVRYGFAVVILGRDTETTPDTVRKGLNAGNWVLKSKNAVLPPACPLFSCHCHTYGTSDPPCAELSSTGQFSETPAGCPLISLDSDTIYLKVVSDSSC